MKNVKRMIAAFLIMVMPMGFSLRAFAATSFDSSTASFSSEDIDDNANISDEEKAAILSSYGFTDEEVQYYVWRESKDNPNRITFGPNSGSSLSASLMSFPKNPKIGDTYVYKTKITTFQLGLVGVTTGTSIAEITKALAKHSSIPILKCIALASTILGLYAADQGYRGFNITVQYTYTYNNDGVADWVYGPITVKGYK